EQRRDVAPVYVHILGRQHAGVLRIEHAHVADHDRIGQAVREAAGELVQPVVLGLYLQPLELGSLPLPALLDDARQTRYHQGEEPVILWPREPDEVRSRVDTDYRVERDRQALAARLQLAVEDLPHRQLASGERGDALSGLAQRRAHHGRGRLEGAVHRYIHSGCRDRHLAPVRLRAPPCLATLERIALVDGSPEGGLALHLERQERAVRGEPRVLLEVRSASVVAVAHLHIDAAVTPHGRDLRAGHPLLKEHRVMAGRVGERRARECEGGGGRGHDAHGCFPLALSPKRGTVARGRRPRRRAHAGPLARCDAPGRATPGRWRAGGGPVPCDNVLAHYYTDAVITRSCHEDPPQRHPAPGSTRRAPPVRRARRPAHTGGVPRVPARSVHARRAAGDGGPLDGGRLPQAWPALPRYPPSYGRERHHH